MLTDTALRKAKPGSVPIELTDGKGLFLLITPTGGRWWRLRYRFGGKEKLLSLGTYPEVSLKAARERRDEARLQLSQGIEPGARRGGRRKAQKSAQAERAANSFEAVAREWYAKQAPAWAPGHGDRVIRRLERDIFPWIGEPPVAEIAAPALLAVLCRIESRGALETAHRALRNCSQVFRYAVATGRAQRDPSGDLKGALPPGQREALRGGDRAEAGGGAAAGHRQLPGQLHRAVRPEAGAPGVRAPR